MPSEGGKLLAATAAFKAHSLRKWPLSLTFLVSAKAPGSETDSKKQDERRREGGDQWVARTDLEADAGMRDFLCMIALQLRVGCNNRICIG